MMDYKQLVRSVLDVRLARKLFVGATPPYQTTRCSFCIHSTQNALNVLSTKDGSSHIILKDHHKIPVHTTICGLPCSEDNGFRTFRVYHKNDPQKPPVAGEAIATNYCISNRYTFIDDGKRGRKQKREMRIAIKTIYLDTGEVASCQATVEPRTCYPIGPDLAKTKPSLLGHRFVKESSPKEKEKKITKAKRETLQEEIVERVVVVHDFEAQVKLPLGRMSSLSVKPREALLNEIDEKLTAVYGEEQKTNLPSRKERQLFMELISAKFDMSPKEFMEKVKEHPLRSKFSSLHASKVYHFLLDSHIVKSKVQLKNSAYVTLYGVVSIRNAYDELKESADFETDWANSPRLLDLIVYTIEKKHVVNLRQDFFGCGSLAAKTALSAASAAAHADKSNGHGD